MRESEPTLCMDVKTMAALKENRQLGVGIAYKNDQTQKWGCVGKNATPPGPLEISEIMLNGQYNDACKTFVIVNKEGELCYTNSEQPVSVTLDQSGFIHINNDEYLIKPVEGVGTSTYIGGQNLGEINNKVQMAIDMGFVRAPQDFGPNGFTSAPVYEPTDSCQE